MTLDSPIQDTLRKRKREDDNKDDDRDGSFIPELDDEGFDELEISEERSLADEGNDADEDNHSNSDSDQAMDDDDDDCYNESQEAYPADPAYDPQVPQIKEGCTRIAGEVEELLSQSKCNSEAVKNFESKAKELKTFPVAGPVKAGMLGATGVGMCFVDQSDWSMLTISRKECHHKCTGRHPWTCERGKLPRSLYMISAYRS